jgi:hypothetical protein
MLEFLKPLPIKNKIRLGSRWDGGYVVYKKALDQTDVLMTYGVGWDVAFEEDFNSLTGKEVYMFDPTMFGKYMLDFKTLKKHLSDIKLPAATQYLHKIWKAWRKRKALKQRRVYFVNEGIAPAPREKYNTFDAHVKQLNLQGKRLLLKIDIEGREFNIFGQPAIYEHLGHVNQLILEIHNLKNRLRAVQQIFQRLSADFELIHVHGVNLVPTFVLYGQSSEDDVVVPDTIEVTFVKRELIDPADVLSEQIVYPVPGLDFPNNPDKKDLSLAFI